jgi:pilus assembly protein CpaF
LIDEVLDETFGFGPLEMLFNDPMIHEIRVNGPQKVDVVRRGKLELGVVTFRDEAHLRQIIDRIVSRAGVLLNETTPIIDVRLPDGWRVNAVLSPIARDGCSLNIRRCGANPIKLEDLLNYKAFTPEMAMLMEAVVKAELNVVVSGDQSTGTTTLLNCLCGFLFPDERVVLIEDFPELALQQRQVVRLAPRRANAEGKGAVSACDLLDNAPRMFVERIVLGECRGGEALKLLYNPAQVGFLTTVRAVNPRHAQSRLELMLKTADREMSTQGARELISSGVDLIIQTSRLTGGPRKVTSITEVLNMEQGTIILHEVFRYRQHGIDQNGRSYGQFESTGFRPSFMARLEAKGIKLPKHLFEERVLLKD